MSPHAPIFIINMDISPRVNFYSGMLPLSPPQGLLGYDPRSHLKIHVEGQVSSSHTVNSATWQTGGRTSCPQFRDEIFGHMCCAHHQSGQTMMHQFHGELQLSQYTLMCFLQVHMMSSFYQLGSLQRKLISVKAAHPQSHFSFILLFLWEEPLLHFPNGAIAVFIFCLISVMKSVSECLMTCDSVYLALYFSYTCNSDLPYVLMVYPEGIL